MSASTKDAPTWTVWVQPTNAAGEVGEQRRDTYDLFGVAREFAIAAVEYEGVYNARVINSKGVEVYNAKKSGIKRVKRPSRRR